MNSDLSECIDYSDAGAGVTLDPMYVESMLRMALTEDIRSGDITTELLVPSEMEKDATATFVAKQNGIAAGIQFIRATLEGPLLEDIQQADFSTCFDGWLVDGSRVAPGDTIAALTGQPHTILRGERVALNFLQRMSGIATLTDKYVQAVAGTKARIVDTRKTTPGLRRLEKYAVTVGGGYNHRFGLDDGILIKDNHIAVVGSVTKAVTTARHRAPHMLKIEVEVTNLDQLREALDVGADIVMLDNMDVETMREAVGIVNGRALVEASGGVNLDTVRAIAETGVDIISVGALTHSAPALDISLDVRL